MTREAEFAVEGRYRRPVLVFGIGPSTARVLGADDELLVRGGPWRLPTALSNIAGTQVSTGYAWHPRAGRPTCR